MAGIGLYGVFYKKCIKVDGVCTGYEGAATLMGKAISANFEPNTPEDNPLYANNGVAENDISAGSGGTLTTTLDRMTLAVMADLYGTTVETVTAMVDGKEEEGQEIGYKGDEVSAPVGAAYIRLNQEDGVRSHEVVFYREVTFTRPSDSSQTMARTIEWQTPELTGTVAGMQGDGSERWYRRSRWPSQAAAIAYIYKLFGEDASAAQVNDTGEALNEG